MVGPATIGVIHPRLAVDSRASEAGRRLALAQWIADPANPLPARVMVNRVWHYHFGRGIVATPSDFGFNGAAPSHPELLDWLASTYIAGGWRLKPIHRLIVTSSVYRQSSRLDPRAQAIDRDNRLLWRMTPRRLEAESLRDAILATSGQLDSRMGGPGYNIWEPNTNYVAVYKPAFRAGSRRVPADGLPVQAAEPARPDVQCLRLSRRGVGGPAPQCLDDGAPGLQPAQQPVRDPASDLISPSGWRPRPGPTRPVRPSADFAWRLAASPHRSESNAAVALIGSHGCAAFCRALYNANEFVYVP